MTDTPSWIPNPSPVDPRVAWVDHYLFRVFLSRFSEASPLVSSEMYKCLLVLIVYVQNGMDLQKAANDAAEKARLCEANGDTTGARAAHVAVFMCNEAIHALALYDHEQRATQEEKEETP